MSKKDVKTLEKAREANRKYEKTRFKVRVRYTREEEKLLKGYAEKAGKEVGTYVHDVSLKPRFQIIPATPKINLETKIQIQKIGVNLNQIARALNNYYETKNFDRIEENLSKMSEELHAILTTLRA